jgi:hypothetical protein
MYDHILRFTLYNSTAEFAFRLVSFCTSISSITPITVLLFKETTLKYSTKLKIIAVACANDRCTEIFFFLEMYVGKQIVVLDEGISRLFVVSLRSFM